jgi:single-strand DNA-binding protein
MSYYREKVHNMANNTNICVFTGNVVRDPETRVTSTGKSVAKFSIAINKGARGHEKTLFLSVSCWEKLGGIVQEYAYKGDKILVSGALECNKYTDKNGAERQDWGITASSVELLGGNRQQASESSPARDTHRENTPEEDEIPF